MRVAITQPYVPAYRRRLWELVIQQLADEHIEARVFYGANARERAAREARGDAVDAEWAFEVPTRMWGYSGAFPAVVDRQLPRDWRRAILVTEMQATNVNAWRQLVSRRPFVTFGHGESGTTSNGSVATRLRAILNRHARQVVTYTEEGRTAVIAAGRLDPSRVTAFGNATDTSALRAALARVDHEDIERFNSEHGIDSSAKIALVLGAMRENKRISLLVDAARRVLQEDQSWWIVAAGDGPEAGKLRVLQEETGRVVMLGHASADEFAPAASQAQLLLNPGRIGLVAVDALVMGLPVLTAPGAEHAPEAAYLEEGLGLICAERATDAAFAEAWLGHVPATSPVTGIEVPSIEKAANRIARAILCACREGQ
ncbi:glycosyltransferase [Demequina sp. NBRC 110054]|uniref:glycosyltransferase n=1 Tax=Demequina sp. NBRC 110054 TaxID=1570343 RepID=UPI0013565650|nr:glycosyltransferase [Demequina sp. NBRC 110054]